MKKIVAFVLALLLLIPSAFAEVDLSSYSYEQLLELYRSVQQEIISRPEWKEVTVPKGVYVIGEDIPAGSYTIKSTDPGGYINIFLWGAEQKDYDTAGGLLVNEALYKSSQVLGRINLKNGNVLELSGTVIMTPVQGLGF